MPVLDNVTVLILDDNPLVLKLGRALLEREGCTVLTASSWIEFNHVLAANTPDLIFLDVNLPSIKGNRLSEVLKSQSNKKEIPIVLISDLPEKSLEDMFPSSGANAWMRKPLTREKLVDGRDHWPLRQNAGVIQGSGVRGQARQLIDCHPERSEGSPS